MIGPFAAGIGGNRYGVLSDVRASGGAVTRSPLASADERLEAELAGGTGEIIETTVNP